MADTIVATYEEGGIRVYVWSNGYDVWKNPLGDWVWERIPSPTEILEGRAPSLSVQRESDGNHLEVDDGE